MVSDSIINASLPNASKDFGKKKRANRSARLKQHKLHTRREQWLSQGQVRNKGCKEDSNGVTADGEFDRTRIETRKKTPCFKDLELRSPSVEIHVHHDTDSDLSPENSPISSVFCGNDSAGNHDHDHDISISSSSISSSSFCSGGCCSGSISDDEEEGGDDDGCLDDWEAMADALAAEDTHEEHSHEQGVDLIPNKGTGFQKDSTHDEGKSKFHGDGILGRGVSNTNAWRPDDAFRPHTLPNLSKQHSFPANVGRYSCRLVSPWVRSSLPTSCPICCEDLDLTDTRFLPCSCGFRLCLFCHKRILEEDGRCPGCRKPYDADPVDKETNVSGGSITIRLARSCSMFSRV